MFSVVLIMKRICKAFQKSAGTGRNQMLAITILQYVVSWTLTIDQQYPANL